MFGSRAKGAGAELAIAQLVEVWWSAVEPNCRFKRTPGSGGWGSPDVRGAFKVSGDLCTTAKRHPFCHEVKRREGWTVERVICGRPSPVWQWWRQAQQAARESQLQPILWMKQNRQPWWVVLPDRLVVERGQLGALHTRWARQDLLAVDHGPVLPALFEARRFLETMPDDWL